MLTEKQKQTWKILMDLILIVGLIGLAITVGYFKWGYEDPDEVGAEWIDGGITKRISCRDALEHYYNTIVNPKAEGINLDFTPDSFPS